MAGVALLPIASVCIKTGISTQPKRTSIVCNRRRSAAWSVTKASFVDTGYLLADAASKVADTADKAAAKAGSVDAPGWVLPVA